MSRLLLFAAVFLFILGWFTADHLDHREPTRVHAASERHHDRLGDPLAYASRLLDRPPPNHTTTTTTPKPKARTAPTVRIAAVTADVAALQAIIRDGFARFGAHVAEQAVRVAGCESTGDSSGQHLDPNATGAEGEVGLLQLHPRYQSGRAAKFGWTVNDLYDPAKNVTVGADLYSERGWQPWSCRHAA